MNLEFALETPNFVPDEESRRKWWPIRPNTGYLWADILWLLVVAALDSHIIPSVTGGIFPFQLLSPWLVVVFIVAPIHVAFVSLIIGSLILETSSATPRGFYLTSYWVIFSALILSRKTLSWRHVVPWLVTFFLSAFFISNFETLLIFLRQDPSQLDFFYFAKQVLRIAFNVVVGMSLAQSWMTRYKGAASYS